MPWSIAAAAISFETPSGHRHGALLRHDHRSA